MLLPISADVRPVSDGRSCSLRSMWTLEEITCTIIVNFLQDSRATQSTYSECCLSQDVWKEVLGRFP